MRRKLCNICSSRYVTFDEVTDSGSLYRPDPETNAPVLVGFSKLSDESTDEDGIEKGSVECYSCWEKSLPEVDDDEETPTYTTPMKHRR